MSYFNFLSPDLQDDSSGESDTAEDVLKNAKPGERQEYKPYSQRRGEASDKVFQAADAIIDKYAQMLPFQGKTEAEQAKREIRANPDEAAKTVEKFYKTYAAGVKPTEKFGQPQTFTTTPNLYDTDFSNLENHVRGLRSMKRGSEEKGLQEGIATTDLGVQQKELQGLRNQLDTLTKDIASKNLPEAVSEYGEQQNKKALADKQAQAAAIAGHIKQLENKTADYSQETQPQAAQTVKAPPPPDPTSTPGSEEPLGEYLGALGIDNEKKVDTAQKALQIMGVHPNDLDKPVPTHAGLMRVLSALDPKGTFAQALADEMAQAKAQDAQEKATYEKEGKEVQGRMDQTQQNINSREARMKQLYQQLNETPFMQTWPGIIMYVITGMLVGPGIATKLFGNLDNRRAIGNELAQLKFDIRRYDRQMEMQEREKANIRSAAIHRMQNREDRDLTYSRDLGKIVLQHNLILAREGQRHPEQASAYKQLGTAYVRERNFMQDAQHRKDEAQRILSNDFADEGLKKKASADMAAAEQEIQQHKARAMAIDATIKKMGGIELDESEDSQ